MKIAESKVNMTATSKKETSLKITRESGMIFTTAEAMRNKGLENGTRQKLGEEAFLDISDAAKKAAKELEDQQKREAAKANEQASVKAYRAAAPKKSWRDIGDIDDPRIRLLQRMIELLSGKRIKFDDIYKRMRGQEQKAKPLQNELGEQPVVQEGLKVGEARAMLSFSSLKIERYEKESVSFSAEASVKTEDGRSINVSVGLNMARELYEKLETTNISIAEFCDPLVINYSAAFAGLSDTKIEFDLDCDGKSDQISTLLKGSGFLAIDDGSGTVKDGNQLFGAKSGDGFADLAEHDSDGNGWIDENDAIWDKLRVWAHNEDGSSSLIALGEVGVGAIYLGNVATNFTMDDKNGDTQGMLRRTGFFLFENGEAGTVQHVDLKI